MEWGGVAWSGVEWSGVEQCLHPTTLIINWVCLLSEPIKQILPVFFAVNLSTSLKAGQIIYIYIILYIIYYIQQVLVVGERSPTSYGSTLQMLWRS